VLDINREFRRSFALVERNFNLIKRYLGWEIVFLIYTIVNTLTIAFIGLSPDGSGQDRVLYLVVGALLWGFLSVLFHEVAESVQWERWEGTIEYSFMAPVRRLTYLGGVCLYAATYGAICPTLAVGISLNIPSIIPRPALKTAIIPTFFPEIT
jgi:ABC-2 type transport system permease protein